MLISNDSLIERYRAMDDDELQQQAQQLELTAEATTLLRAELQKRGLALPPPVEAPAASEDPVCFDADWRLETLARYLNIIEAKIHCALLQSEGIKAVLADENAATTNNQVFYAMGGIRLQVPLSQMDEARQILAETRAGLRMISDETWDSLAQTASEPPITTEQFIITWLLLVALTALLASFVAFG